MRFSMNPTLNPASTLATALAAALVLSASACNQRGPAAAAGPAPAAPGVPAAPLPERTIAVTADEKGFTPSRIEVKPHEPLLLRFTRTAEATCADQVVFKGDPVKHLLPLGKTIEVRMSAPESGAITFACGMNMFRGSVVVAE